jgi:hypothetical protein
VLLVLLLGVPLSSIRAWISNSILWSDSGSYFPSSHSDEDNGRGPGCCASNPELVSRGRDERLGY